MAALSASAEEIRGGIAIRIHAPGGSLGDPYDWHCVATRDPRDPEVAVIHLAPRAPTRAEIRALTRALREHGFRRARWERMRGGRVHETREFGGIG